MKPAGTEHKVVQIGQVARHEKVPRSDRRDRVGALCPKSAALFASARGV
jgi:hypothetical protein